MFGWVSLDTTLLLGRATSDQVGLSPKRWYASRGLRACGGLEDDFIIPGLLVTSDAVEIYDVTSCSVATRRPRNFLYQGWIA